VAHSLQIRPIATLICLIAMLILSSLGLWQTQRYQQKKAMLAAFKQQSQQAPIAFSSINPHAIIPYQKIQDQGYYQNQHTLLWQNRFHQDQSGVEVLTPVAIVGQKSWLIVDRGFIATSNNTVPSIKPAQNPALINGTIYPLDHQGFSIGPDILPPQQGYEMIQKVNIHKLQHLLKHPLMPFMLHLNAHAKNGFIRQWVVVNLPPARHISYAIQWFLMAFAVLIYWILLSRPAKKDHTHAQL